MRLIYSLAMSIAVWIWACVWRIMATTLHFGMAQRARQFIGQTAGPNIFRNRHAVELTLGLGTLGRGLFASIWTDGIFELDCRGKPNRLQVKGMASLIANDHSRINYRTLSSETRRSSLCPYKLVQRPFRCTLVFGKLTECQCTENNKRKTAGPLLGHILSSFRTCQHQFVSSRWRCRRRRRRRHHDRNAS